MIEWTRIIAWSIPVEPVAQPRPRARATIVNGRPMARIYNPTTVKQKGKKSKPHPIVAFKEQVIAFAKQNFRGPLISGPVRVDVRFIMPRLKQKIWKIKPMPRYLHETKPDRDNLEKSLYDALSKIVWEDDNQICAGMVEKWGASGHEHPHIELVVSVPRG